MSRSSATERSSSAEPIDTQRKINVRFVFLRFVIINQYFPTWLFVEIFFIAKNLYNPAKALLMVWILFDFVLAGSPGSHGHTGDTLWLKNSKMISQARRAVQNGDGPASIEVETEQAASSPPVLVLVVLTHIIVLLESSQVVCSFLLIKPTIR